MHRPLQCIDIVFYLQLFQIINNLLLLLLQKLVECIRANKEDYVVAKQECSEVLTEFGNCLQSRPEFIIAHRYAEQYSRSANKD